MTAKVVEVIEKILDGLNNKNISLEEVNNLLVQNKEFDQQTVSAAFSLVYDKVLSHKVTSKRRKKRKNQNFRLLTGEEQENIGQDNYNYLIRLHNVGLLDTIDFEMVLEQLMMFPSDTITKDEINWIILISLVEFNAEILPGSRILLYSSDTIN